MTFEQWWDVYKQGFADVEAARHLVAIREAAYEAWVVACIEATRVCMKVVREEAERADREGT